MTRTAQDDQELTATVEREKAATKAGDPRVGHPGVLRKEWREGPQRGKVTYYAVGPSRETEEEAFRDLVNGVGLELYLSEIKPLAALALRLWTADLQTEGDEILTELRAAVEGLSDETWAELTEGSKDR